jgi:hypothetical protein
MAILAPKSGRTTYHQTSFSKQKTYLLGSFLCNRTINVSEWGRVYLICRFYLR